MKGKITIMTGVVNPNNSPLAINIHCIIGIWVK